MSSKVSMVASEVRVNDHIYNGSGSNTHPTLAWETVTEVHQEDGFILLITGDRKGVHGEFWLEPDEQIAVIRYPEPTTPETTLTKSKART